MLAHILTPEPPSRLVPVTQDPVVTYGEGLVNEIMEAQPEALIWNTDERGNRPDVLRLAYSAYLDFGAEAVVCIANKTITCQVVDGMKRRDVPVIYAAPRCGRSPHER